MIEISYDILKILLFLQDKPLTSEYIEYMNQVIELIKESGENDGK